MYYREAGAGELDVFIEGPAEADVKFEPRQDGSVGVSYAVTFGGEYTVTLKWNGVEVPDSPFVAYIGSEHQDARKARTMHMHTHSVHCSLFTVHKPVIRGASEEHALDGTRS